MLKRNSRFLFFYLFVAIVVFGRQLSYAEEQVESSDGDGSSKMFVVLSWPFEHVFQPVLNGLVFPIAAPVDYVVKNGIADKSV